MDRAEGPTESAPTDTSAGALINASSERTLRDVLFRFGEEPRARRIAAAIVAARPLSTTTELADVIRNAVPREVEAKTLARVFQAIRIEVNRELEALEAALDAATELVKPGGRLVVIAYHSLEDRIVKRFLRSGSAGGEAPRDLYGNVRSPWRPVGRVVKADEAESAANPRSRSARLRIGERTDYDPIH
jgi:16S rRNA (cytosine1402-N4)-methyltransferase